MVILLSLRLYTFNVQATILFAANIAFLAIPSVLPPDTGNINAAATASIISMILSFSSIIFGQNLSSQIKAATDDSTYDPVSTYSRGRVQMDFTYQDRQIILNIRGFQSWL